MLGRLGCCITNKMYYPKYQRKRSSNFVISSREKKKKKTHVTSTIEHETKERKLFVEDINCNETMKYLLSSRDIVSEVLSHMDVNTLCRASQVCKLWRDVSQKEELWMNLVLKRYDWYRPSKQIIRDLVSKNYPHTREYIKMLRKFSSNFGIYKEHWSRNTLFLNPDLSYSCCLKTRYSRTSSRGFYFIHPNDSVSLMPFSSPDNPMLMYLAADTYYWKGLWENNMLVYYLNTNMGTLKLSDFEHFED